MSSSISRLKTNENIQVYLRVRPMNGREKSLRSLEAVEVSSNREVVVKQDYRNLKKFTFDRAFGPESKQAIIYQSVVAPFIEEVLAGYNCTVFAYGQTGTGKTHTMIGEECPHIGNTWDDQNSEIGIIPRAVSHLFEELRILGVDFSMRISFLELYNEELSDLLSSSDLPIRIYDDNSKKGSIIVHGLEELLVHNSSDVYKLLAKGQDRRKTASTLMNIQSSRSHTIFSILVHIRECNVDGEEVLKVGKLNLVDLAGSENISKAGNEKGIRTRETVNINQSLLTLGRVITALVERTPHIPYRESKLTRLLQESLGGRTKTSIIATVSPGHKDLEETLSTLEYAHRAKNIQNKPEINQKLTKKLALKEYNEEIDRLKRDLMASRSKNGIYLAEETYNEMTCRLEAQNRELSEKHTTIKVLKDEVAKIQTVFNEVSLNLVEKETELADTYETLHNTKAELGSTVNVLRNTTKRYQEKKKILASHIETETILTSQAQQLKSVADLASTDAHLLHDTIERRKLADHNIVSVCDSFQKAMHKNISEISLNFDSFNQQIDGETNNFVELLDSCTARNANFTSIILQKLSIQRQTSEVDTDTVKRLVENKLTDEMTFNAAQLTLVESVIKEVIETERKFTENFTNEMQTSLLNVINEQANQLMANNLLILEMVNSQRNAASSFCSVQRSNLETFSTEISKLLQDSQTTVESTIAENDQIAELLLKLSEKFKSSNDKIKTILPNISQSIGISDGVTKEQFERIERFNADNEKGANHINNELIRINTTVKDASDSNQSRINRIIQSVRNKCKLGVVSLKSSMHQIREKCCEAESKAHTSVDNIKTELVQANRHIDLSVEDITNDVQCESANFQDDCRKNIEFKTTVSAAVDQFNVRSKQKFEAWRATIDNFRQNEIKTYSSSGATPAKREFNYPKVLAVTSPHNRIIRKFWAEHNESDLDVTAVISEGNESDFLNGLDEIRSSSMLQQDPIPDRVLNEIRTPVVSSLAISNGQLKGPSKPAIIDEVTPIRQDSANNRDSNDSNKENL